MKKNKILIGVISIMFAGIIILGIIECNNSNTKDNDKLFIGNGKFCQAKRLNGLGAIYDDDYIFFDCENQIYESYNYSNKKNDKKLNVNCRNSACSHSNDTCEAYVELGEYFVFNSKIYKYYNKSKVVSGENRLYGSIVEEESGKTVFKNSIPTDMSSELAIDDSEAILYVRVLSDDIVKVDGDRHAYLLDKNFNIIYCHYNIGKFPWGAILNGNYYYINDINEIVKVNLTTFESKSIASNGKAFMADNDENFIYYSNEFSELYKLSPDDESSIKIADNALFFSVQNKYIYASGGDNGEGSNGGVDKIVDGNAATYWHSKWRTDANNGTKYNGEKPHWFEYKLSSADSKRKLKGIHFAARLTTTNYVNGKPYVLTLEIHKKDGTMVTEKVQFSNNESELKTWTERDWTFTKSVKNVDYIKVIFTDSYANDVSGHHSQDYATCAEFSTLYTDASDDEEKKATEINITHMTSSEFVGHIDDINTMPFISEIAIITGASCEMVMWTIIIKKPVYTHI